jgi:hypothetical protein
MSQREADVYVYGVVHSGRQAPRGRGVVDTSVATIECGEVAAIASTVKGPKLRAKRRDLLRHSEVLQEAFAGGPVLPLRFGTVFQTPQQLIDEFLAPRERQLASLLERYDGMGELRLRVAYADEEAILGDIVRATPELVRLREQSVRADDEQSRFRLGEAVAVAYAGRRDSDAQAIVDRLAPRAVDVLVDAPQSELEVLRASFLVDRRELAAFDEVLESIALRERHLLTFSCTGPVPPHSFVNLAEA